MITRSAFWPLLLLTVACQGGGPRLAARMEFLGGDGQIAAPGSALPQALSVRVTDETGDPISDIEVTWSVLEGGGSIDPATSVTSQDGIASAGFILGPVQGLQQAQAAGAGLDGSPVVFTAIASTGTGGGGLSIVGGGNNANDRYSSDLWVHGNYAYTGTWRNRQGNQGNVLKVWSLDASGAPLLVNSVTVPGISTVSDVQVSSDGRFLVLSGEFGSQGGIHLYGLSNPADPAFLGSATTPGGVHTVTLATIAGRDYAFAAKNPALGAAPPDDEPALLIYDVTDPAGPALVHRRPIPANYGIHDTYVRDGLAFVFAWNEGFILYDVGNGIRGGSPSSPVEVSRLVTSASDAGSPAVHNGWWFHNLVTGERRYLFIGQEGPNVVGSRSSGDIHVVDVSDLAQPREVAFFHLGGAGPHNFWVDEQRQILYAAYYNAGVVALDISGTLSGSLLGRFMSLVRPGGAGNTFTWGVQLANGWLYAIDMLTGLWQLRTE